MSEHVQLYTDSIEEAKRQARLEILQPEQQEGNDEICEQQMM